MSEVNERNITAIVATMRQLEADNTRIKADMVTLHKAYAASSQTLTDLIQRFAILEARVNMAEFGSGPTERDDD